MSSPDLSARRPSVVDGASFAVIPGAGSAGLTWAEVAGELGAAVLRAPDEPTIPAMAAGLDAAVADLPRPRVLIGASMGAMVSLEIARDVEVDALVLIAAGFGIEVGDRLIEWMVRNPPGILEKMAKICLAHGGDRTQIEALVDDYRAGGHERHIRQMRAMAAYKPELLADPPPTLVLWGALDSAVPLEAHIELALRCGGALIPIADAAHVPFFEQPRETLRWIRRAALLAEVRAGSVG
ncbi:MAG: alpha/beta fold hydrolase [Solirubrobacteraceae bacterium]